MPNNQTVNFKSHDDLLCQGLEDLSNKVFLVEGTSPLTIYAFYWISVMNNYEDYIRNILKPENKTGGVSEVLEPITLVKYITSRTIQKQLKQHLANKQLKEQLAYLGSTVRMLEEDLETAADDKQRFNFMQMYNAAVATYKELSDSTAAKEAQNLEMDKRLQRTMPNLFWLEL